MKLQLVCDNCGSQNKNKYLIGFLFWLVNQKKILNKIILNFLLEGHGKNRCDQCFGLAKKNFKNQESVQSYQDICKIVDDSSTLNKVI